MTKNKKINLTMMIVFIFMNFVLSMSSTLFNGILDKMVIDLNVSLSHVFSWDWLVIVIPF